jgi:hypothetical protein
MSLPISQYDWEKVSVSYACFLIFLNNSSKESIKNALMTCMTEAAFEKSALDKNS